MSEFQVGLFTYRTKKMPPMVQFHIGRRLSPFISAVFGKLPKEIIVGAIKGDKLDLTSVNPLDMLEPLIAVMGSMSDADSEYVIYGCMEYAERKLPGEAGWAAVKVQGSAAMQYQDISMVEMLQIAWVVVKDNLGNFFPAPSLTS